MTYAAFFILGLFLGVVLGVGIMALLRSAADDDLSDSLLLDTVQRNRWQIGCIDDHFAVIGGSPPKVIGAQGDDVRVVIAGAKEVAHV